MDETKKIFHKDQKKNKAQEKKKNEFNNFRQLFVR